MSTRNDWRRVSKAHPCPICGKPDWCAVSTDGAVALCHRVESSQRIGDGGWLHRLQDIPWQPRRRRMRTVRLAQPNAARADLPQLAASYRAAVNTDCLYQLALELGLSTRSLQRLSIGWSAEQQAWSFPMTDAVGNVCGIRLRRPTGSKFAVKGGREGLFIPDRVGKGQSGSVPEIVPLIIVEDPTDTVALLDMGFNCVVGRPSCTGGTRLLVELVKEWQPSEVVIVADNDEPGRHGADTLAARLVAYAPAVRIIQPPDGIKDARVWLWVGGTQHGVHQAIQTARVRRLKIKSRDMMTYA